MYITYHCRKMDLQRILEILQDKSNLSFDLGLEANLQEIIASSSLNKWEKRRLRRAVAYHVPSEVIQLIAKYLTKYNNY